MAKKSLDLLIALGGPKSKNANGMTDASMSAPDQSGNALAPGGDMVEDEVFEEEMVVEPEGGNFLVLPPGFKIGEGEQDGVVTTTIRGRVVGDKLYPEEIGGMPVDSAAPEAAPEPTEPEQPEPMAEAGTEQDSPELADYKRKKSDEQKARAAFQS